MIQGYNGGDWQYSSALAGVGLLLSTYPQARTQSSFIRSALCHLKILTRSADARIWRRSPKA